MKRIIFLISILIFSSTTQGFYRVRYEDATVVERSDLIVVGQIKEGSIQYMPHERKKNEGASWEYHIILKITEILKGKCEEKEIPIIIHYGLTPVVGGYEKRDTFMFNPRGGITDYPEDIIEIFDTGNSGLTLTPLTSDSRKDNLWFLRKMPSQIVNTPGELTYGIRDPEDHQSIEWKDYFLCYLTDNPETAVKEWVEKNPDKKTRAQNYFDHLEIHRILEIKDTQERVEKLFPYFIKRTLWNTEHEAEDGITVCGQVAGDYLIKVFDEPQCRNMRGTMILMWRDMNYKECIPFLIELLKKYEIFWSKQNLEEKWQANEENSELSSRLYHAQTEVYYAVAVLKDFQAFEANDIIETTREQWKSPALYSEQIVEECEDALKKFEEKNEKPQI